MTNWKCSASLFTFLSYISGDTGADAFELPIETLVDATDGRFEEEDIEEAMEFMDSLGVINLDDYDETGSFFVRFNREKAEEIIEAHHKRILH